MNVSIMIMMLHALSVVGMEQKEKVTIKKTTDVGAIADGEYLKPAQHVAMSIFSSIPFEPSKCNDRSNTRVGKKLEE